MRRSSSVNEHAVCRRILELGQRLAAEPDGTVQRQLIAAAVAELVGGQARLWLFDARGAVAEEPPSPYRGPPAASAADLPSITLPLRAPNSLIGLLEVWRPDGPPFGPTEIELLHNLAAQAAIALQSARQLATERWRIEQLSLVRQVSAQVTGVPDLDELARRVTALILQTFQPYYVALFLLEPGRELLRMGASAGPRPHPHSGQAALSPGFEVKIGQGIVGQAAATGAEIVANDVSREPRFRYVDTLPETRSEVALPLKIEGRVLGVLDVQSNQTDAFDETNLLVLRALADNVAMAVEQTRLYADIRRRADQLAVVSEVVQAVASILDLDLLLNEIVHLIHKRFGYPFVYLFTVDSARQQVIYRAGAGQEEIQAGEASCRLDETAGLVSWVACHNEDVLSNDVTCEPRYCSSPLPPADTRAELSVPLIFGNETLGVLDVRSNRAQAFTEEDRFLLKTLANGIAIAIRNANLYRSERWRRQVAESLREVAGRLSTDVALDQELDAILLELERTLPCDAAAIWLLHGDALHLSAVRGHAAETTPGPVPTDAESWLGRALHADQPLIRTPDMPFEPLGATLGFPPDYSAIAAPLRIAELPLGVLTLIHHTPGRYGAESRMITSAFASHAAVAIENTRLYEETQELARVSTVMLRVVEATRSLTTLDQVLKAVVRFVPTLVGVERCAILLWEETTGSFLPAAAYGLSPGQHTTFREWEISPGDEPIFDDLRREKTPVFVPDVGTDPRLADLVIWDMGFESLLLIPLLAQDEVIGAMLIDYPLGWLVPDASILARHDKRLATIQGVALQAAAAIETARLREAQQMEAYVSAALLQVAQAVAHSTNLDEVLSTIMRLMPILVGVRRCAIFLWNAELSAFYLAQAYGLPRQVRAALAARPYAVGDCPLLDMVRERATQVTFSVAEEIGRLPPELVNGLRTSDLTAQSTPVQDPKGLCSDRKLPPADNLGGGKRPLGSLAEQLPSDYLRALPLAVRNEVLGVMVLSETAGPRHANPKRLEIIAGIANQAAMAIQSDLLRQEMAGRERLERELQLAHDIQQTFMPDHPPELPGWELAFAWQAAHQVAGDFYDVFTLPDGRLGLVIADVADKGMPAALFMALTRTLVRAAALEENAPARAMARVNDLLVPDAQSGMFVTIVYGALSLKTGEFVYANAGHNLPLLLRSATRELSPLRKGGMAIGVMEGISLEEHTVRLEPGDYLIFYTDGLTEAFSPDGEMYGEERLRAVIQAAADCSARALLKSITTSVSDFIAHEPPSDDLTVMILRRA